MTFSEYFTSLEDSVKQRYFEKIRAINNIDPYTLNKKSLSSDMKNLPQITYIDIYNYLILRKSAYTQEEFRAYKSLDSYKFFKCGWVKQILSKSFDNNILVLGQVLHSQRINEKPLECWFIAEQNGEILSAHCMCIAGLGETCSHVSALMFNIDDIVRNLEPVTVTGEKSYWLAPSTSKKVKTMASVQEIDFGTEKSKHKVVSDIKPVYVEEESIIYNELDDEEMMQFLQKLHGNNANSAILLVTKPFCMEISSDPAKTSNELSVFKKEYLKEPLEYLVQIGSSLNISLKQAHCRIIEEETRGQANNKYWFLCRKGRITASVFKNVCRTSLNNPSISLLKRICYPHAVKFTSAATKYGCEHENDALESYKFVMSKKHKNLKLQEVGLILNEEFPMFGASPDSLVTCDCCGEGCIEIKCPFCARNTSVEELLEIKKLCLTKNKKTDEVSLNKTHQYYYQCQMQLALSIKRNCDFVVWSTKDIYIERIKLDSNFWDEESKKAKEFFKYIVLPELLGKYFTRE